MKKKKQKSVPRKKIKKSTRKTKSTSTNSPPQGTGLSSASSPSLLKLNQGTKVTLSSFVFFMKNLFVHEKISISYYNICCQKNTKNNKKIISPNLCWIIATEHHEKLRDTNPSPGVFFFPGNTFAVVVHSGAAHLAWFLVLASEIFIPTNITSAQMRWRWPKLTPADLARASRFPLDKTSLFHHHFSSSYFRFTLLLSQNPSKMLSFFYHPLPLEYPAENLLRGGIIDVPYTCLY